MLLMARLGEKKGASERKCAGVEKMCCEDRRGVLVRVMMMVWSHDEHRLEGSHKNMRGD